MIATFLDETLVDRMVSGFREHELKIPGFVREEVDREPNQITWRFTATGWESTFFGEFDGQPIVAFEVEPPTHAGDILRLKYVITWRGGGGNGCSLPPSGGGIGIGEKEWILSI